MVPHKQWALMVNNPLRMKPTMLSMNKQTLWMIVMVHTVPSTLGKLKKKDLKSEARLCYLVRFYLKRSLTKLNERRKSKPTTLPPNILNCLGGHFEDRVLF